MRCLVWMLVLTGGLLVSSQALHAEPPCCKPPEDRYLKRLAPVGGWCPYGTGPLSWWDSHWFPCIGGPDDYCRKPLPAFGWPCYPCFFGWAPPECCPPGCKAP